jgi:Spy/CpxP family protein refolding chaperone
MTKLMLVFGTLALMTATAQRGPWNQDRGGRTPPTPEQMVERRVERLTLLLTLTPSQQAQAKTIFTDENTAAAALRTAAQQARAALRNAVESRLPEPQIEAAATQTGVVHGQLSGVHAKAQARLLGILTVEQRDKLSKLGPGAGWMGRQGMGGMQGRGGFRGNNRRNM